MPMFPLYRTSQLICSANQLTSFYMRETFGMKDVKVTMKIPRQLKKQMKSRKSMKSPEQIKLTGCTKTGTGWTV